MSDYDTDFVAWAEVQAEALRHRSANAIDWNNVAEEIESLGRSERSAVASHVRNVLEHLLKLQASHATMPRAGWRTTIARERANIARLLNDNPSLVPTLPAVIAEELPTAGEIPQPDLEDRTPRRRRDHREAA